MFRSSPILLALAYLGATTTAAAQAVPLSSDEIREEFLGTRMSGKLFETGVEFVECIEPDGRSIYRYGNYSSEGEMSSVSEGVACFTYDDRSFCYEMFRYPGGYIVSSMEADSHYIISKVERSITRCTSADLIG